MRWLLGPVLVVAACGPAAGDDGATTGSDGGGSSSDGGSTSLPGTGTSDGASSGSADDTGGALCGGGGQPISLSVIEGPEIDGWVVAVDRLDGDGLFDVIATDPENSTTIAFGTEPMGWAQGARLPGPPMQEVVTGDLDGDGAPDLVGREFYGKTISVRAGATDGSFTLIDGVSVGDRVLLGVAIVDAMGDGVPDILASLDGAGMLLFADGVLDAPIEIPYRDSVFIQSGDLAVGDLDGAPGDDVVVSGTSVLTGGRAGPGWTAMIGGMGGLAVVGQLDGVGASDVVVMSVNDLGPTSFLDVHLGTPAGFADPVNLETCVGCITVAPTLADVDGDGSVDLAYPTPQGVEVRMGCGDGTFGAPQRFGLGEHLFGADLDGDGDAELVGSYAGRIVVFVRD